jgi:flagellar biosynthesis/type III secretory pathway M-ring protein FliF/YscJ
MTELGVPMPIFMLALLALATFLCMFVLCVVAVLAESRQRRRMAQAAPAPGDAAQERSLEPQERGQKSKAQAAHG